MLKIRKSAIFCIVILLLVSLCACSSPADSGINYEPKTYSVNVAYIGNGYQPSENVTGVTVYSTVSEYNAAAAEHSAVWVEYGFDAVNADFVRSLISSKSIVAVLSDKDRKTLTKELSSYDVADSVSDNLDFRGLLFSKVMGETVSDIGLYSKGESSMTDFLAFCTQYPFAARYQGDTMVTETKKSVMNSNFFNAVNFSDDAYSVSYLTIAEYKDNPVLTENGVRCEYTVLAYTDVVNVKGKSEGFTCRVNGGETSILIGYSPNQEIYYVKDTDMKQNFLYRRYFNASVDMEYSAGLINPIIKDLRGEYCEWEISTLSRTLPIKTYCSNNLSVACDFTNSTGYYLPSCRISFVSDTDGQSNPYYYTVYMNHPSLCWDE